MNEERGLIPESVGEAVHLNRSPFVQGFMAGLRGLLVGAPAGAITQIVQGKNPLVGAVVGGVGAGLAAGFTKGLTQKMENVDIEENMRYHALQMKAREPLIFMPPPSVFARVFNQAHRREHDRVVHVN